MYCNTPRLLAVGPHPMGSGGECGLSNANSLECSDLLDMRRCPEELADAPGPKTIEHTHDTGPPSAAALLKAPHSPPALSRSFHASSRSSSAGCKATIETNKPTNQQLKPTNQPINNSNNRIQTLQHRWGGLWLAATHRLDLGFPAVVGCALLSSIAIVWLDTADIVTCMLNFPAHGGDVAGAHCRVWGSGFSVRRRAGMLQQVKGPRACSDGFGVSKPALDFAWVLQSTLIAR